MNEPLISVIIPVYNTKKYLQKCFRSIKNQSYKNLEIIIVNDGSSDNSSTLCEKFKNQDKRVKVINQKNQGLSAARNAGLKICKGDFITFVDSDDAVEDDFIEYLFRLAQKENSDIAICAHKEIKNEKIVCDFGKGFSEKTYNQEECLKNMLNEQGFMVSAWGKLYRKELFKNIYFPVGKLHEDLGTTYKLILKANKIIYGPKSKYLYYQHPNSIISSGLNEKKLDIITQTDEMCKEILKKYPNLVDVAIARQVHARFSVLRLMVNEKKLSQDMQKEKQKIKTFLKNHQKYILHKKSVPKRTKIAMRSFMLGEPFFKLSWNIYSKFFK